MNVDVVTEIDIARPREEVAAYAADPGNATAWYRNIKRVEWKSAPPLRNGSRVAFVAQFLGRTIAYTYEVRDLVPGERLAMATAEGPFAMETTYSWRDTPGGGTTMTLRNRGEPSGFGKIAAPVMARAMRRANRTDLERLKQILEG
ncbi:MAG TPA: SRPBCC family protein [Actinomycetota bacterium]|nr:SRPBCC family protein [Actinomycetota bacterium]